MPSLVNSTAYVTAISLSENQTDEIRIKAHTKEKLSKFCISATGFPLIVIMVKGVFTSLSWPYQSIARTAAWAPSQLQLDRLKYNPGDKMDVHTWYLHLQPTQGLIVRFTRYWDSKDRPKSTISVLNRRVLPVEEETIVQPKRWDESNSNVFGFGSGKNHIAGFDEGL